MFWEVFAISGFLDFNMVWPLPARPSAPASFGVWVRGSDYNPCWRDNHESLPQKVINLILSCSSSRSLD